MSATPFEDLLLGGSSSHGVSLFETAFPKPDTKEGKSLFAKALKLPDKGNPAVFFDQYKCNLVLARLILEICQNAAEAIEHKNYKHFDALIRNFGCQITALQNHRLLKKAELREEAKRVHHLALERLATVEASWGKPPIGKCGMSVVDYLKMANIDITLSVDMAQLVRFRILNIVNTNVRSEEQELPCTKVDAIVSQVERIVADFNFNQRHGSHYVMKHGKNFFEKWISGLQAEEAAIAVRFIQKVELDLLHTGDHPRAMLVERLLGDKYVRASKARGSSNTPIVSLPQLYTGEAALESVEGLILIKNKLTFCGEQIPGVLPMKAFIKMPEGKVLSVEEIHVIPDDEPVYVLEGYIPPETLLDCKVKELGVATLLNATLARLPQYASGTPQEEFDQMLLEDREAEQDLKNYAARDDAYRVIQFDHIYCGSLLMENV